MYITEIACQRRIIAACINRNTENEHVVLAKDGLLQPALIGILRMSMSFLPKTDYCSLH